MRNLKKVLALVLVFAMMLSSVVVASAASFPDVDAGYQYSEAIGLLASLNILGGYEDGTFKPNNNITRAEFSKMLYVVFNGMDDTDGAMFKGASQFKDVATGQWFNGHVNWASENAIVGGYGDGTFLPNNNIAIKEAIKMVVTCVTDKALTYPNGYVQEAKAQKLLEDLSFTSVDEIATRGQIAQIVFNLLYVRCRLCLRATGQYNTDVNGNNVEVYEKVAPIEFVFGLNAIGGTEDSDAVVELVSTFENSWTGAQLTAEEGKVTLSVDGVIRTYDYAADVNDLFGQRLIAYTDNKGELVSLISVSEVMTTTLDKCSGNGTAAYPYGITGVGETNTDESGASRYVTLDRVFVQDKTGRYIPVGSDVTVKDGATTKRAVKLSSVFAERGYNASNPVTFIDYDADGTYETMIVDYVGTAQVQRYTPSTKMINLIGVSAIAFDNAIGHEAFANLDYTDPNENPVFANYTLKQNGAGVKVYTLSVAQSVEGLLTSVDSPANIVANVGGTAYKAVGIDPDHTTKISSMLLPTVPVFDAVKNFADNTVKLYLNDAGYVVAAIVVDPAASYDLNMAKIIEANDTSDKWGNNVVATLTVVLPDGTQQVLTLDTTIDARVSDDTHVTLAGRLASFVASTYDADTATADPNSNEVFFTYNTTEKAYDIVGEYVHFEIDDDTNQVVRLVALDEIGGSIQPTGSTTVYSTQSYNNNLCYDDDNSFFIGDKDRAPSDAFLPADNFVGMYYEENEDGEIESFFYTASNIPTFYNQGEYLLVFNDEGEVVAMAVKVSPDATASDKVLGVITGFSRVSGESLKNNKNTYRIQINMWVNGENQTFYTEDATAGNVPNTDYDELAGTGLTTNRLVVLQLKTNGKVNVVGSQVDVDYVDYPDLTFAYARSIVGKNIQITNVAEFRNAQAAGWTMNPETGEMIYNEQGSDGVVTAGAPTTVRISDETTIITVNTTPKDIEDATGIFQEVTTGTLTAGGTIERSNAQYGLYYLFAYNTFAAGEAEDSNNEGSLKTLIIFSTPVDAPAV